LFCRITVNLLPVRPLDASIARRLLRRPLQSSTRTPRLALLALKSTSYFFAFVIALRHEHHAAALNRKPNSGQQAR
jgi:hypothetical protein